MDDISPAGVPAPERLGLSLRSVIARLCRGLFFVLVCLHAADALGQSVSGTISIEEGTYVFREGTSDETEVVLVARLQLSSECLVQCPEQPNLEYFKQPSLEDFVLSVSLPEDYAVLGRLRLAIGRENGDCLCTGLDGDSMFPSSARSPATPAEDYASILGHRAVRI